LLGIEVSVIVKSIAKDAKLIRELNSRRKTTFIGRNLEIKFIEFKPINRFSIFILYFFV
jgi:hypothetical protein